MSRFLIGTIPVIGHVSPAIPIARKLIEKGHQVQWYTGQAFQSMIEKTGAQFKPMIQALDYSIPANIPNSLGEKRRSLQGVAQLKFDLKHFFIDAAIGQLKDCLNILEEFPADVVLVDSFFLGASWLWEKKGTVWAEFGVSVLAHSSRDLAPFGLGLPPNFSPLGRWRNKSLNWIFNNLVFKDITNHLNKVRQSLDLPANSPPFFDIISPFLYLAGTVSEFDYSRSDLLPQVHFIGPLLPEPSREFRPPPWWDELKQDKPVIFVTQGTVATQVNDLIIPTLQALAQEDVIIVVTTGEELTDSSGLTSLSKNVKVEKFIPYSNLLPYVDIMITNGGYNGVQQALANGVPLIVAGKSEDKAEVCARVEWSGVGINLKTKNPKSEQIKKAIRDILSHSKYLEKAQYFQEKISHLDSPSLAVELLEKLAISQAPILNTWSK